ncbi:2-oxo-4-hydroxy-4-carboxy-5-ureidoimidazoline decarboxylase [Leptinotarsa decemlineata]|uniref:2-oxo-4-hydroxy-4-carboxy-5-ureidoimidazoline decarboxylase n=1 Tax=Leptinotarsa decemlineata TaxID=7539 RepID=UPI003D303F11
MFVTHQLSIEEVNNLLSESFVRIFGNIVEHYPAAAISILKCRPFSDANSLVQAIYDVLDTLRVNEKESILQQYPDIFDSLFACYRPVILEKEAEETFSGTSQLSAEDKRKLMELNTRYKEKYGFPFIIGTKKNNVYNVFSEIMLRLQNSREDEIHRAIREVKNIVYLRVHDIIC